MASAANPSRPRAGPVAPVAPPLDRPALEVRHKGLLTVAIMMATVMQILDTTIANVALPHMQTSLGATADTVTWVLTSYILATAVAINFNQVGIATAFLVGGGMAGNTEGPRRTST